ncbi:MAG: PQQ-binding-like beta-propeller repeat protein [Treponema sp.]|jgi:outer membrane protein assembly factor BamB|nr:PQQ-binding-like beta-propeller repeat protein [Treponema sp.]
MKYFLLLLLCIIPLVLPAQSGNAGPSPDRERGQVDTEYLWRQALGGAVIGQPTVQAQSVVMALDGGNVKAYSASGKPLWNYSARGRLTPFVTRSPEGISYISRTNGIFMAVNRTGRELWRTNPGGPLSGPVALGWDGRLFIPSGNKISCYTAAGNLLWTRMFEERIPLGPLLDRAGGIIFALENGEVIRLDPYGAMVSWKLETVPQAIVSFALTGAVQTAPLTIMTIHKNGELRSLFPAEPDRAPVNLPRLPSAPAAAVSRGSRAAITLTNGQVALVSGADGKILWTGESHIRVYGQDVSEHGAAMLFDERGIYVLTANGATGFSEDGRRLWFTSLKNAAGIPAFGDDGILYSGGVDWILYAWKLENRSLRQTRTLYGPAPEGSYGTGSPPPSSWANFPLRYDETGIRNELDTIRRGIQAGRVGENELEWAAYLMETVAGETSRPGTPAARPPVQLYQRAMALRLLARIGSRETIPWLTGIFRKETDPVIRAAAAAAIGSIGVDPDGIAMQAFLDAASTVDPARDEQALIAVAAATGALCRFSGPPLFDAGARVLILLCASSQPPTVQRQAHRELQTLRM